MDPATIPMRTGRGSNIGDSKRVHLGTAKEAEEEQVATNHAVLPLASLPEAVVSCSSDVTLAMQDEDSSQLPDRQLQIIAGLLALPQVLPACAR